MPSGRWLRIHTKADVSDVCPIPTLEKIVRLRLPDGSPPQLSNSFNDPVWLSGQNAPPMLPDDPVLGLLVNGKPYVLPWWAMRKRHAANLTLDGQPILVTLCAVCSGSAGFTPLVDGKRLNFRSEALCNGTPLLADVETQSLWAPFLGLALNGPLTGRRLERLPIYQSTWAEWIALHPETMVPDARRDESRSEDRVRYFPGEPSIGPQFLSTLPLRDERLPHNTLVLGVEVGGACRAYPLSTIQRAGQVVNDNLGGEAIVVVGAKDSWMAMAFLASVVGSTRSFTAGPSNYSFVDCESGSVWSIDGVARSGPLEGRQLTSVNAGIEEWYSWIANHATGEIYTAA